MQGVRRIKGEVELKGIDARFAEDAKLPRLGVTGDQGSYVGLGQVTLAGDTRNLEFSRGRRDVRIEAGTGGGDQVGWDERAGIFLVRFFDIGLHSVKQCLVGGTEIGAAAGCRIVPGAGAGWPRMEIARPGEGLPDKL